MADNPILSTSELEAKAARLEGKKLFVKAADIYLALGQKEKAASALEQGGAYEKAAELYDSLGMKEKAAACRKTLEAEKNPQTWSDLQAEFVSDYPG